MKNDLHAPPRHPNCRRGSIYIVTLSTTMIVAALAITALSMVRIDRRRAGDSQSVRQAELYAQSALEIAKYQMRTDSTYRSKLASNTWNSDTPIGEGFYSFTGADPLDGNLTNGSHDPIVITAVGKSGTAIQRLAARFEFEQPGLPCMQAAVAIDGDINIDKISAAVLSASLFSNRNIKADHDAVVTANCEAVGSIETKNGATISGTTLPGAASRTIPDATTLINGYSTPATTILATSLPLWDREFVSNPGAETGAISPWGILLGSLSVSSSKKKSGNNSFLTSLRATKDVVPGQTLSGLAEITYDISGYVLVDADAAVDDFRLKLRVTNTSFVATDFTSDWVTAEKKKWVPLSFSPTLNWPGTFLTAALTIETKNLAMPFYFDDMSIKENGAQPNTYVIHRQLLSSASNPFTGVLNTNGIYKLNCGGATINIRDSRILGTLILSGQNPNSRIEGSICWQPKVYLSTNASTANLPALLTDSKLTIALSNTDLSEAVANVNFNSSGSPWNGSTDSDRTDSYPSQISGVLFSGDDLTIAGYTTIVGNVLGKGRLDFQGADPTASNVRISHQPLYYYVNPPHGFRDAPIVRLKSGSVEQIVP